MRYVFKQKSETARSGVSKMPIDDGIIQMINKRNRQSLIGNQIDDFPRSRRNNLERVKRSLRKRKKCAKKSDRKIARRRNNYANDDDIDEQNPSSNVIKFPIWQVPEATVPAINSDSTTNPTIMETEMNDRSLLAFERPPSQLENLDYNRSVNEATLPIADPNPRRSFDINVSNKDLTFSKIANPKSEIKVDVRSSAFKELNNKMLLPEHSQGFQKQHDAYQRDSSYNVKKEPFDDRLTGSNRRFLLVPISKNLYVLKDVRESPRTGVDEIIVPKRYKLLERDKNNATSAILSFKAHMHHDVKDVGRAYLQRVNHHLFDHDANYFYPTLDPRVPGESANPTENPASYPDFLYPGIAFRTRSKLIDATPEISDEQIVSPVPDYANVSFADNNLRDGINSYDSSAVLSSSSIDIPSDDVSLKENANDGQSSVLSATKLDDEMSLFQQASESYGTSLGYSEFGIELTTTDFRDIFDTHDDGIYTPATFEMYLTNDKEVFAVSQKVGDDSKFSTGRNEDEPVTDFVDNISTVFDASANEDNTFFPNITYTFVDNAEDVSNSEDIDKDSQEYRISIPGEYNNKKSTYSNDFDYNRSSDVDLLLNAEDYVTAAPNIDKWSLKKAQSNVENSRDLLMAIKPLSSELQKLLNAVKLVNRSLSDVQSRLCDKKNVVRTERENKDRKVTNIANLTNKVDRCNFDSSTESFNSHSSKKKRIKTKDGSVTGRDAKIRKKTNGLFLNKLTTPFYKRESSITNSKVQSDRNFLKKRKLNEREFPKSGDVERRRLPYSRFNRNLKSLTKNYEMKPIQQLIGAGLKRMKRTTMSIARSSRLMKNYKSSKNNFAGGRTQSQENNQISRSIIPPSNTPSTFPDIFTNDNSARFLSDQRDPQLNVKRVMSSEISSSDKEKKFSPTDPQLYREATAYLDILRLLSKTEKPYVGTTQYPTESLSPPIFTTTEFSVSALTFLPYLTEKFTITTSSTIVEEKGAPEMTESSLYATVTDFGYSEDYERNYTRMKDYEDITPRISEIISLTQSPVTLSAFTITMPITSPLYYTTELTILPFDEAAISTTEKMTIISPVAITTEVTETPIVIPTIETLTTETAMLLTPFLEGMTDITMKITIPAATSIEEMPASIKAETVTTEEKTVEVTSTTLTTETMQTFSTVSLFKSVEAELTIETTSSTVPVSTTLTITKGFQTTTSESTFGETLFNITTIASSPIFERTETILSTSTEVTITTLIPEDESPVTQIEKTITAEETATEIPTTIETATATEIAVTTTETSTTATEISTSVETTITEMVTINKTLTTEEASTSIETSTASEIPMISTTYITTESVTSESITSSMATTSPKEFFPTSILTTFTTIFTTETTKSILVSSTPVTATSVETTVPTLKLTTTTPLQTLITNTTLSETPYTTISSTFLTTTVPTTSLKVVTTTPLSLITSTMLSETPSTTLSTFLIEETTASSILTTSSLEALQTTAVLPIRTTVSTVETFLTTSSIAVYMTENATVSGTTASTITAMIFESTISPVTYSTVTTPSITKIPITTPVIVHTGTTAYETTSPLITSSFLTETIEGTTSSIKEYEETKEYEKYYYKSTKEKITTWVTEEVTIVRETTPTTYSPSFTTPFFIETTAETISLAIETITLPTITEETVLTEKIVTVTPTTTIEGISTLSEVTLISTETSTVSAIETSSLVSTIAPTTTVLPLEETATEITKTSWIIPTTEKTEYATILETAVTVTLAPFSESILSIIITSETPATTPEVISVLPKTVSEEFTMSTTESPSVTYATKNFTLFIGTTTHPTVSISPAITEETLEAETEYYVAKEPSEEEYEEYEEYDTEIPTGKWYYYDEYETTTKKRITATVKYTKLPKEKVTSLPYVTGTTTSYEIETSEFTTYSTPSEIILTYTNVTLTAETTSETPYTEEEEVTSTLETSALTIIENVTTVEAKTEFTASTASERTESTTWLTFGSTEEYTLPPSTTFKIPTEPLEYLTIPPKYTDRERFTQIWREVTFPKFITKPKKIPEIILEKTTASERVSTETETTETVEKLTSFFVSSALTTLTEKEAFEVHTTTMSTVFFETEGTVETGYEVSTLATTKEETITPFITSEAEIELLFTTTSETVEREEEKEQLLQRLDHLKQHEREMAEREERLKEKEKQWDVEKENRRKMMQREKEKAENITTVTGTTEGYVTTTVAVSITSPVETVSTSLTVSTTEIEIISPGPYITTSSLAEVTTVPTETIPFSIIGEITSVTYTTEETEKATTEESTSTMYITGETEEIIIPYTTEEITFVTYVTEEIKEVQITDYVTRTPCITIVDLHSFGLASIETTTSYTTKEIYTASYVSETTPFSTTEEVTYATEKTEEATTEGSTPTTYATEETVILVTTEKITPVTYFTEEIEEVQITDYATLMPYVTTSIIDLYNVGLASIETVTPYAIEEMYTTSYVTLYSEPLFASSTVTSPITLATEKFITLPIATFSERFEEVSVVSVTTPTWYTTEETYTAIYSKPLFTSPTLEFTSTTTSSTLAVIATTEVKYDEEVERLKEKLRKKERELEERERILLEREERLEKDIIEFKRYMKAFEEKITSVTPSQKSTVLTSLSTPVPPTEMTTIKVQLTTQIKGVTEKKENRTTTKMVTSRQTEMGDIQEKNRTKYVSEEAVTQKEEEIVTKRVCLNVLENTTIPLDKRRRNIVTKKICLPYFPAKNEERRSVGRLSRKLLALQSTRKMKRPRWNVPLDFRCRRRVEETTRKIDNLQLSLHEWLSNETTKPLQHFKGFIRIYRKMKKFPKKVATVIDTRGNTTSDFQDKTSLYEQRVLDYHKSIFQPTATSTLDKEHRKRNAFFRHDLISARKNNFPIDDKSNVRKRDVSPIKNDARFWTKKSTTDISSQRATTATAEEDGSYTVKVLQLSYDEDKQTHEIISAKPDEDELTAIISESNDDNYVTEFGEDRNITTPYYEIEEEDNLKEEDDELTDKTEKKMEENEDYIEDMIDNYMNYEEHETSTWTHNGKFLNKKGKDKRTTENERQLLDQSWPTEQSTTYHLGGTRFWELDFVTEPSAVLRTTVDKSKPTDVSITRTTCFDVVLKNERSSEVKSNVSYHKRDVYNSRTRKNVYKIEKRNASLRNVTRTNALRYKLRTKRPGVKKLKRDSQKLNGSNGSKRNFGEARTMKFNDFRRTSNEDSITAKTRKLCGVNASKLKRQVVKHQDATDKHKEKQPAKSRTLQNTNLRSLHNTDNCVANKKNKYHKTTTAANGTSFPLDEIKALNCSEYKETQDKMVISMDTDAEEAREFPQPHYNIESLKGQKYIKLEELEDNFNSDLEFDRDHDVVSLPGVNLNLPCNQDGDGITWLSSVSRPSYTWKRTDGIAVLGFVAENGDLELRNVNAKDTGNYTCVMTYTSPDNEEPVETAYEIHLQVVTLPRHVVHGESRYHVPSCDERDLDVLVTYLPLKLNSVICEADVCNAYVLTPSCSRSQITVNILLVPSHIVKLMTIDPKRCNVFCLKAIQDKVSLILSKNLQIFLGKTIIFRLPHYEQRLVPIVVEKSSFARRKRGKTDGNASAGGSSNVGLFSSCPAGYGLRDTRCVPCNVGTYSEDGVSHCKKCPPGTYQPNHGARVCRTCTNPMTKGCYNMLWNSFSAIMVTLASVGAMLSICVLLLWIICCAKKKFCVKRIAGIVANEDSFEPEKRVEEQLLIKDASDNEDQQWDSENRVKRKKGKFYLNKKRRKPNERRKYDKAH
ncbi:uncharacterized protein LOC112468712, partial [Temnothorax curvispinosus]|uniref:Uncharacterized protein LOC112468712 n=1 Tax=Temnothorax curvispinosus TaxID=300111 RepID=A0A6J1RMC6_9HYME